MGRSHHAIRHQILELEVDSEAYALAVRGRLADLNRERLWPVIERALDRVDVPGQRIHLDRLWIDLGTIPFDTWEGEVERRLGRELEKALKKAVALGADGAIAGSRRRSEAAARIELFEYFLIRGLLPFWAPRGEPFSFEQLFLELAERDPEGLISAMYRAGRHRRALERSSLRLPEASLHRLVGLLEPVHATLIVTYVRDLRRAHRLEPIPALGERRLEQDLWVLTQAYLVREPGSQFNRKSFVRALLRDLARHRGIEYGSLLRTLRRGLEHLARKRPPASSLVAVLAELVEDDPAVSQSGPDPVAEAAARFLETLPNAGSAEARRFLRQRGDAKALGTALAGRASAAQLDPLLDRLCPGESNTLRALTEAFAAVPTPFRPSARAVHRAVLAEAVRIGRGGESSEASLVRLLRELFRTPLSEPVARTLALVAENWNDSPRARPGHGRLLEQAIRTVGPRDFQSVKDEEAEPEIPSFGPMPHRSVLAFLLGNEQVPGSTAEQRSFSDDELRQAVEAMLEASPEELGTLLRRRAANPRTRERWIRVLPETSLARIGALLEPHRHRSLIAAAEVLFEASVEVLPSNVSARESRRDFWRFVLGFLCHRPASGRSVERLVAAYFEHQAKRLDPKRQDAPGQRSEKGKVRRTNMGSRLHERALRGSRAAGFGALLGALEKNRQALLAPWNGPKPAPEPPPAAPDSALEPRSEATSRAESRPTSSKSTLWPLGVVEVDDPSDPIYIDNAGLVLTNPFLTRFFEALDLLDEDDEGQTVAPRDPERASRAVHLLQYLVNGRTDTPEPELLLAKLLTGIDPYVPVAVRIEARESELETCDRLLGSMLANWSALSGTSVEGLRQTFLQREGRLERTDEGWRLRVQRKTVDVLVDQIPWSLSTVLHPWMPGPVQVSW